MAEILLFHHAQGLTGGCLAFADELRGAGHTVHAPDLYDGRTFDSLAEGVGHAEELPEFGGPWPEGLPLQIHLMEDDELVMPRFPYSRSRPECVLDGKRHACRSPRLPTQPQFRARQAKPRTSKSTLARWPISSPATA